MELAVILVSLGIALYIITKGQLNTSKQTYILYRQSRVNTELMYRQSEIFRYSVNVFDRVLTQEMSKRNLPRRYKSRRDNPRVYPKIASSHGFSRY